MNKNSHMSHKVNNKSRLNTNKQEEEKNETDLQTCVEVETKKK